MTTALAPQPIFVHLPCTENYEAMTSVQGGKFCTTCQHTVQDFTNWNLEEIVRYLKSQNGKVCGRFSNEQLGKQKSRWTTGLRVSVLAVLALWFSKTDIKAQSTPEDAQKTIAVSDSVILLVRGEIKSEGRTVYRSTVEALDSSGNVIASVRSYSGKFELRVPVAYPKQPFTIVVRSRGYRDEKISDYVSSAGNVLGIEMNRRLFGKPSRGYVTVGCPSF